MGNKGQKIWEKLEREGKAKKFTSIGDAVAGGFTVICHDGWFLKGGSEVPREAFPELLKAISQP